MDTSRLEGLVAIVTGGAGGIGRATALALAGHGARVTVVDVDAERVAAAVAALRDARDGGHLGLALDVRREEDMEAMARRTLEAHGRIDALVACAGILRGTGSAPKPLAQIGLDEWEQVIGTNLRGTFLSNRAVLPAMLAQRRGIIVNVSSVSGRQGRAHDGPYCASKFGIVGLSESLAEEVRHAGVKVEVVMPDAVDTRIWEQNGPVPRPDNALPPERVADLITYLIAQPEDTVLLGAIIAPFRARRRLGGGRAARAAGAAVEEQQP